MTETSNTLGAGRFFESVQSMGRMVRRVELLSPHLRYYGAHAKNHRCVVLWVDSRAGCQCVGGAARFCNRKQRLLAKGWLVQEDPRLLWPFLLQKRSLPGVGQRPGGRRPKLRNICEQADGPRSISFARRPLRTHCLFGLVRHGRFVHRVVFVCTPRREPLRPAARRDPGHHRALTEGHLFESATGLRACALK